jgi:hypothetical protein
MTPQEKRYLKKFCCVWCEQRLDRNECLAFGGKCSQEAREKRRQRCLKARKSFARNGQEQGAG